MSGLWGYARAAGHNAGNSLGGFKVEAADGSIGKIDKHSDEVGAACIVVDTGVWIFGKDVLLPAGIIEPVDVFTHGHALQLHAVRRRFLGELAARTLLLPGSGEKAFIDVDSTHKRVYSRTKQGAEYGR